MSRLTWRNVATPDFRDVAAITGAAGENFAAGFSGLGDIAGGIHDQKVALAAAERKRMEDAMMQQVLSGSDATADGNWRRMIAAGPASRLDDMNELLKSQSGLVDDQVDRRAERVDTQQAKFNLGVSAREDQRNEETRQLGLDAAAWHNNAIYDYASKEEASRANALDQNITPAQRAAREAAINGTNDAVFGQNPDSVAAFESNAKVQAIETTMAERATEIEVMEGLNPALALLSRGSAGDGDGNVEETVAQAAAKMVGADGEPLFEDSPGELTNQLNGLIDEYGGRLGADIVRGAFLSHVESADFFFQATEDLQPDINKIKSVLDDIDTPEERKKLVQERRDYEERRATLTDQQRRLDKARNLQGVSGYRPERGAGFLKESGSIVDKLLEELNGGTGSTSVKGSTAKDSIASLNDGNSLLPPASNPGAAALQKATAEIPTLNFPPQGGGAAVPYAGQGIDDLRAARTGEFRERNLEADALDAQRRAGPGGDASAVGTILDAAVNRVQEVSQNDPATRAIVDAFKRTGATPNAGDIREKDAKAAGLSPDTIKQFNALRNKEAKGTLTPEQRAVLESLRLIISVSK